MERGPQQEALNDQQPDLLEAFGDQEVTIFGVTGTFKDLAGMCPVDLSDPRISREMTNDFVVKFANEAGIAVQPEYEQQFVETLERHGLERKFTVAEPAPEVLNRTEKPQKLRPELLVATSEPDHEALAVIAQLSARAAVESAISAQLVADNEPAIEQPFKKAAVLDRQIAAVLELHAPVTIEKPNAQPAELSATIIPFPERAKVVQVAEQVTPQLEPESVSAMFEVQPAVEDTAGAAIDAAGAIEPDEVTEALDNVIIDLASRRPDKVDEPSVAEADEPVELQPQALLLRELRKEPIELYEDFTSALQNMLLKSVIDYGDGAMEADQARDETMAPAPMDPEAAAVLTSLVENLSKLDDEKTEVAEVMQSIVGALHGIAVLETSEGASAEQIATTQEQLMNYCKQLFELAGLEPSEAELQLFVQVISSSNFIEQFVPKATQASEVDAENYGGSARSTKRHSLFMLLHLPVGRVALPSALAV